MVEREKGQSLLELPTDYTVIDIETTGYDPRYDFVIEFGGIKYRDNEEVARYETLIKPPSKASGEYIDDYMSMRTGITNEMLETAPILDKVAKTIWEFIKGEKIVGHNVNFDINFLYDVFKEFNSTWILRNDFVDTLRLARRALPELEHHRLEDLDNYFGIGISHHRAIPDCETTNIVLREIARHVKENNIDLLPPKSKRSYVGRKKFDLRTLNAENTEICLDSPLYKKVCVFTGTLEMYTRKEAAQIVVNLGGSCDNGVTKRTNFLIVGDFEYSSGIKDGKSNKLKRAEQLISKGQDLQILSEKVFYDMINDAEN